jgi:hypothetical protein
MTEYHQVSSGFPSWVLEKEDMALYGEAIAFGANELVTSSKEVTLGFVAAKRSNNQPTTNAPPLFIEVSPSIDPIDHRVVKGKLYILYYYYGTHAYLH